MIVIIAVVVVVLVLILVLVLPVIVWIVSMNDSANGDCMPNCVTSGTTSCLIGRVLIIFAHCFFPVETVTLTMTLDSAERAH